MFDDRNFIQIFNLKQIKIHLPKTTQVPTCLFITFFLYVYNCNTFTIPHATTIIYVVSVECFI